MRYIRHGNGMLAMYFKMSVGNNKLSVNVGRDFDGLKPLLSGVISHRIKIRCYNIYRGYATTRLIAFQILRTVGSHIL